MYFCLMKGTRQLNKINLLSYIERNKLKETNAGYWQIGITVGTVGIPPLPFLLVPVA